MKKNGADKNESKQQIIMALCNDTPALSQKVQNAIGALLDLQDDAAQSALKTHFLSPKRDPADLIKLPPFHGLTIQQAKSIDPIVHFLLGWHQSITPQLSELSAMQAANINIGLSFREFEISTTTQGTSGTRTVALTWGGATLFQKTNPQGTIERREKAKTGTLSAHFNGSTEVEITQTGELKALEAFIRERHHYYPSAGFFNDELTSPKHSYLSNLTKRFENTEEMICTLPTRGPTRTLLSTLEADLCNDDAHSTPLDMTRISQLYSQALNEVTLLQPSKRDLSYPGGALSKLSKPLITRLGQLHKRLHASGLSATAAELLTELSLPREQAPEEINERIDAFLFYQEAITLIDTPDLQETVALLALMDPLLSGSLSINEFTCDAEKRYDQLYTAQGFGIRTLSLHEAAALEASLPSNPVAQAELFDNSAICQLMDLNTALFSDTPEQLSVERAQILHCLSELILLTEAICAHTSQIDHQSPPGNVLSKHLTKLDAMLPKPGLPKPTFDEWMSNLRYDTLSDDDFHLLNNTSALTKLLHQILKALKTIARALKIPMAADKTIPIKGATEIIVTKAADLAQQSQTLSKAIRSITRTH